MISSSQTAFKGWITRIDPILYPLIGGDDPKLTSTRYHSGRSGSGKIPEHIPPPELQAVSKNRRVGLRISRDYRVNREHGGISSRLDCFRCIQVDQGLAFQTSQLLVALAPTGSVLWLACHPPSNGWKNQSCRVVLSSVVPETAVKVLPQEISTVELAIQQWLGPGS